MECDYPISIFDNFYNNPDAVREYALSLEYTKITGFFPGYRTECLSTINKEFWELSYQKFLPDNINPDEYTILSQFQKVYRFSNDPKESYDLMIKYVTQAERYEKSLSPRKVKKIKSKKNVINIEKILPIIKDIIFEFYKS